jgi:hypothetical protein
MIAAPLGRSKDIKVGQLPQLGYQEITLSHLGFSLTS